MWTPALQNSKQRLLNEPNQLSPSPTTRGAQPNQNTGQNVDKGKEKKDSFEDPEPEEDLLGVLGWCNTLDCLKPDQNRPKSTSQKIQNSGKFLLGMLISILLLPYVLISDLFAYLVQSVWGFQASRYKFLGVFVSLLYFFCIFVVLVFGIIYYGNLQESITFYARTEENGASCEQIQNDFNETIYLYRDSTRVKRTFTEPTKLKSDNYLATFYYNNEINFKNKNITLTFKEPRNLYEELFFFNYEVSLDGEKITNHSVSVESEYYCETTEHIINKDIITISEGDFRLFGCLKKSDVKTAVLSSEGVFIGDFVYFDIISHDFVYTIYFSETGLYINKDTAQEYYSDPLYFIRSPKDLKEVPKVAEIDMEQWWPKQFGEKVWGLYPWESGMGRYREFTNPSYNFTFVDYLNFRSKSIRLHDRQENISFYVYFKNFPAFTKKNFTWEIVTQNPKFSPLLECTETLSNDLLEVLSLATGLSGLLTWLLTFFWEVFAFELKIPTEQELISELVEAEYSNFKDLSVWTHLGKVFAGKFLFPYDLRKSPPPNSPSTSSPPPSSSSTSSPSTSSPSTSSPATP